MRMKVIIAEKPSLAKSIAGAIGNAQNKQGYYQCGNYIVTYAYGHLFTLMDMDDYFEKKVKWGDNLPFYPDPFQFKLKKDKGVKEQFSIICNLINDPQTDEIISAGDADREGEVIVRLILKYGLNNKRKQVTRLWLPDQTEETIRKQLRERKLDSFYDALYEEGITRTFIDWILGINMTREISSKTGQLMPIGRVICPIVLAIWQRDNDIQNFKPVKFNVLISDIGGIKLEYPVRFIPSDGDIKRIQEDLNSVDGVVIDVQQKDVVKQSPKLFSLSKLQGETGKSLKLKPAQTLQIVQTLYEKGFVTYPRTNTEYLSENEKDKVRSLLKMFDPEEKILTFKDSKRIFDDRKIESHSAIIPTKNANSEDFKDSSEKEVYEIIKNRFLSVFYNERCIVTETIATIQVGKSDKKVLKLQGSILKSKGWTKLENVKLSDKILPQLNVGQKLKVDFKLVERETQPPKPYTVETLGNYLTHPFKKEKETEDDYYRELLDGCEIGTEATRAGIIDHAIKLKYISLVQNIYHIEDKGRFLVEILNQTGLDMSANRTVELQKKLKAVYRGELNINQAVQVTKKFVNEYFDKRSNCEIPLKQKEKIIVGHCPWCGKPLYEYTGKFGSYYKHDENIKCSFSLSEKIKVYGQEVLLTKSKIKNLLNTKKVNISLTSKKGTPYKVNLTLKKEPNIYKDKKYPQFDIEYIKK